MNNAEFRLTQLAFVCSMMAASLVVDIGMVQGKSLDVLASPATVVLHIWGQGSKTSGDGGTLLQILTRVEAAYSKINPAIHFVNELHGNDSALGGVYVGAADIAFMTREPSYIELDGYQQMIQGQTPLKIAVMRGSPSARGSVSPLVLVVNRTNPLDSITLPQLKSIFTTSRTTSSPTSKLWQDLGVSSSKVRHSIHIYGFDPESEEAVTFSIATLGTHPRWTCKYIAALDTPNAARQISEEVQHDPDGLGLTTLDAVGSNVKVLAIAASGDAVLPTPEAISSGEYVLSRTVIALTQKTSGKSSESAVQSFLAFLLSDQGQAIIRSDGTFVSVTGAAMAAAREALR
jgi:phosphate transport system substrate-binding protein